MYYCGSGYSIIYSALVYAFSLFYGISMVYNQTLDFNKVNLYISCIVFYLAATVCFGLIIDYLENMNETLVKSNQSHIKLLNGMHEGLIIISKETARKPAQFVFCNRPARKLMSGFVSKLEGIFSRQKARDKQRDILTK